MLICANLQIIIKKSTPVKLIIVKRSNSIVWEQVLLIVTVNPEKGVIEMKKSLFVIFLAKKFG